jgi:hypothetical protein
MEAANTSERLETNNQSARGNIPEDCNHHHCNGITGELQLSTVHTKLLWKVRPKQEDA